MPDEDAIARAQYLYKKKSYRLALEILESNTRGRSLPRHWTSDQRFALYELRAALNEIQGNYALAHRDALSMIKVRPRDARGYLRLAKVLRTEDRFPEALKMCERGLLACTASTGSREYTILAQAEKSIRLKVADMSQTRCDPVEKLPPELLLHIFEQFSLSQIVKLLTVSRKWSHYLTSEPRYWCSLTIDSKRNQGIRADTIIAYSRKGRERAMEIDLSSVTLLQPERLLAYLTEPARPAYLQRLSLPGPMVTSAPIPLARYLRRSSASFLRLKILKISSDTLDKDVVWALNNLKALESLEMDSTSRNAPATLTEVELTAGPTLKKLSLVGRSGSRCLNDKVVSAVASIPTLQSLDMHRIVPSLEPLNDVISTNSHLKRFGFTAEGISARSHGIAYPNFASQELESLTLNNLSLVLLGGRQTLPLKYLELKNMRLPESRLPELIDSYGCGATLETLVVHQSAMVEPIIISRDSPLMEVVLPQLQMLQYTGMSSLDELGFSWLLKAMPALRKANFDGTTITGPKLVQLVNHGLRAVRCKGIEGLSADTVAWIRENAQINVTF